MENKNIRTFCDWKEIYPHKNFTGSYKKSVDALDEFQDTQNIKMPKNN